MLFLGFLDPDDYFSKSRILSILHRIVCILSGMLVIWYFLLCIFSVKGALDDMNKFGGLGFSYPLQHYLALNGFWESVILLVTVTAEFLLYILQDGLTARSKARGGSIWYFVIVLALYFGIWMYLHLIAQGCIAGSSFGSILYRYRIYIYESLVFNCAYLVLYYFRIYKQRKQ